MMKTTIVAQRAHARIAKLGVTILFLFSPVLLAAELSADKPTVLITGANRGIGLAFVEHYVGAGWNVIATARSPDRADALQEIATDYDNLIVEQLDVTDQERITELAGQLSETPIDVLLNNAGVLGDTDKQVLENFDQQSF